MFSTSFLINIGKEVNLSPEQLEVFILRFGEERTHNSIAEELQISRTAIQKRLGEIYRKFGLSENQKGIRKEKRLRELLKKKLDSIDFDNFKDEKYYNFSKKITRIEKELKDLPSTKAFKNLFIREILDFQLDEISKLLNNFEVQKILSIPIERYPEILLTLENTFNQTSQDNFIMESTATIRSGSTALSWPNICKREVSRKESSKTKRVFIIKDYSDFASNFLTLMEHSEFYQVYLMDYIYYLGIQSPEKTKANAYHKNDFGIITIKLNSHQEEKILIEESINNKKMNLFVPKQEKLIAYESLFSSICEQAISLDDVIKNEVLAARDNKEIRSWKESVRLLVNNVKIHLFEQESRAISRHY